MANEDQAHVALPKLFGAPAYARPAVVAVQPVDRPFDPDALPLEAVQTEEERVLAGQLGSRLAGGGSGLEILPDASGAFPSLRGRPFRLASITGRFRRSGNGSGA